MRFIVYIGIEDVEFEEAKRNYAAYKKLRDKAGEDHPAKKRMLYLSSFGGGGGGGIAWFYGCIN